MSFTEEQLSQLNLDLIKIYIEVYTSRYGFDCRFPHMLGSDASVWAYYVMKEIKSVDEVSTAE